MSVQNKADPNMIRFSGFIFSPFNSKHPNGLFVLQLVMPQIGCPDVVYETFLCDITSASG